jgi:hypothetical protein
LKIELKPRKLNHAHSATSQSPPSTYRQVARHPHNTAIREFMAIEGPSHFPFLGRHRIQL